MSTVAMADTFRRAAEVIRTGGLARGTYEHDGTHCAIGALMAAEGGRGAWTVVSEINYLVNLLGGPDERESGEMSDSEFATSNIVGFSTVVHWNDAAGRTAEEVIALLEQAAEKLEADL